MNEYQSVAREFKRSLAWGAAKIQATVTTTEVHETTDHELCSGTCSSSGSDHRSEGNTNPKILSRTDRLFQKENIEVQGVPYRMVAVGSIKRIDCSYS